MRLDLPPKTIPPFPEFVALIAACMAATALSVDTMLPALPVMGQAFGVDNPNRLQLIISVFFMGIGLGQFICGTLSDWLGRRKVLLGGLIAYVVISFIVSLVTDLEHMLILRFFQGMAAAAASVIPRSAIRDLYSGAQMAKMLSTAHVVFLAVPILAPSLGQLILLGLPWRGIFFVLTGAGALVALWVWLRLPETLDPEVRYAPSPGKFVRVAGFIASERTSLGYSLAVMLMTAMILSYLSLMPQIFDEVFHKPVMLGLVFALCAGAMAVGAFTNIKLVEKLGTRVMSHRSLTGVIVIATIHFLWALSGRETLLSFTILQAATMMCMAMCTSNFTAIAMEKVGHVAGTAASLQGVLSMVGGGFIGAWIGQFWVGGVWLLPLSALGLGIGAMTLIALAEKGHLYRNPA
ncbi:multidrug effflux MFS transporter [Asticcacaulis sp. BYS171W]|uniref:Bcr/CflA family efflux transporter n=1 Tax=Asticcacaulis aquaticus TaxID=2984212 RepID=A0ABT5HXV4_9CAUL|nr:multidrug effflux MFS transporter [Asticcacaulis aquaticus]MDC7684874.1 multidrug effflux MFS transporter [Asticcacaulis aquaticus]